MDYGGSSQPNPKAFVQLVPSFNAGETFHVSGECRTASPLTVSPGRELSFWSLAPLMLP